MIFRLVVFHLPHASYAYKTIGYVTDVIEISCLKKSAAINDVKT